MIRLPNGVKRILASRREIPFQIFLQGLFRDLAVPMLKFPLSTSKHFA